jgi:hypothetical protein
LKQKLILLAALLCHAYCIISPANAQWVYTGGPDSGLIITDVASIGTNIFACNRSSNNFPDRLFISPDNGLTWPLAESGGVMTLAVMGSDIYAGSLWSGLKLSHDLGNSWEGVFGWQGENDVWETGSTLFFSSNHYGLMVSRDSGVSWDPLVVPKLIGLAEYFGVTFGSDSDGLFRSVDGGQHWSKAQGLPGDSADIYEFTNSGTTLFCGNSRGVFRSIDSGAHWTNASEGLPSGGISSYFSIVISGLVANEKFVFAATEKGVYSSSNEGVTWHEWNDGLENDTVTCLTINDQYIFVGTLGHGIWRRALSELSSVSATPRVAYTSEIFPNPTAGSITIHNAGENIQSISILNLLGQEVLLIKDLHETDVTLDLSRLPAGTYFTKFVISGTEIVRKILKVQ